MWISIRAKGDELMRRIAAGVGILGFLLMVGGGVCWAQEEREVQEAARQVFGMDEMVVTATRTEREVKEVSTNVTVLTRKDIETYQPTDLMDLLRRVPGLVLNGQGSSKASFYGSSRGLQPSTRLLCGDLERTSSSTLASAQAIIQGIAVPFEPA